LSHFIVDLPPHLQQQIIMADPSNLTPADFDLHGDSSDVNAPRPAWGNSEPRSPYRLPASEQLRGVANRIIFSRYYIFFYLIMMTLSLATVVLSLIATSKRHHASHSHAAGQHECPPAVWHVLEVIVNALMVLEVSTRWVAYGKVGWRWHHKANKAEVPHDTPQHDRPCPRLLLRRDTDLCLRQPLRRGNSAYVPMPHLELTW
jgi:hypothetical protein